MSQLGGEETDLFTGIPILGDHDHVVRFEVWSGAGPLEKVTNDLNHALRDMANNYARLIADPTIEGPHYHDLDDPSPFYLAKFIMAHQCPKCAEERNAARAEARGKQHNA